MLLALALHLDLVSVGAHHLTRIFYMSFTMPLITRRHTRRMKPPGDSPPPRPFED